MWYLGGCALEQVWIVTHSDPVDQGSSTFTINVAVEGRTVDIATANKLFIGKIEPYRIKGVWLVLVCLGVRVECCSVHLQVHVHRDFELLSFAWGEPPCPLGHFVFCHFIVCGLQ